MCGSWLVTWTAVMIMLLMQVFLDICSPPVCRQLVLKVWESARPTSLTGVNAINLVSGCVCIYVSVVTDADPLGHVDHLISCQGISEIISDTSEHCCHILSATGYSSMGVETIMSLTVLRSNSISSRWGVAHTPCAGRANKQKSSKHLEGVSCHHQATGPRAFNKIIYKIQRPKETFLCCVLFWFF